MTHEHKALVDARAEVDAEHAKVNGGDGYNYAAGQEYGLRLALIVLDKHLAAIESLSAQSAQPQAGEAVGAFEYCDGCSGYECDPVKGCAYPSASPHPANPAQVTELIEEAKDFTERMTGQPWACELVERLIDALTAAIGAGGQAVAEPERLMSEIASWEAGLELGLTIGQAKDLVSRILSALSQPHPADERVVEALREAADRFEEIRVILIEHLEEPQRTAFWKAVNGREFCRHALAQEGRNG